MLRSIEGCPNYEDDRAEWERVVRHHLSEYSLEALIEFAVRARIEVEHLNMHITFYCKMAQANIAGLDILRSLARRNPDGMDIENEIAKLEAEFGKIENVDFLRDLVLSSTKRYTKGLNDKGRLQGSKVMKQRSEEHRNYIKTAVEDIFNNTLTFDWTDGEIARWLMNPQYSFHKYNGITLGKRQMTNHIKEIRKAYKERNNSPPS